MHHKKSNSKSRAQRSLMRQQQSKESTRAAAATSAEAATSSVVEPAFSSSSSSAVSSTSASSIREKRRLQCRSLDALLASPDSLKHLSPLRVLSLGGFQDSARRRLIWPRLLGVEVEAMEAEAERRRSVIQSASSSAASSSSSPTSSLPQPYDYSNGLVFEHRYFDQIEKDINRSMCHFDVTKDFKDKKRVFAREALSRVIHSVFSLHADLHYIQGFHDIASVFLLVCHDPLDPSKPFDRVSNARGEELAFRLTERLALLHIRDSLRPSLDTVVEVLSLIFPLLQQVDPEVHSLLTEASVQSFFTLSWILTWFSHNIERFEDICRVFDFFLSSHPLMPLYATVALIIQLRDGLLQLRTKAQKQQRLQLGLSETSPPLGTLEQDAHATVEMSAVHEYFQKLPPLLHLDDLFARTARLHNKFPPVKLLQMGKLALPEDSPLWVSSEQESEELAKKLGNYLTFKRAEAERLIREGRWESEAKKQHNAASTPTSKTRRGSKTASSHAPAKSFYSYPSPTGGRCTRLLQRLAHSIGWNKKSRRRLVLITLASAASAVVAYYARSLGAATEAVVNTSM